MSTQLTTDAATGTVTIDLARLRANWHSICGLVGPAACGAVVKANAYGLGADRVIPALYAAGAREFFIATPSEAAAARALVPDATLYALDGVPTGSGPILKSVGAIPVISSLEELDHWISLHAPEEQAPVALHVDSGLNRLGMEHGEVDALVSDGERLSKLSIVLVMSHLASADDPSDSKSEKQLSRFNDLHAKFPNVRASLAASDGLMLGSRYHFDLVRPGYALYGGQAFRGGPTPVGPVVRVEARILQVRSVAAGETVGYSGTWMAERPSRVAIVAAGYADGIARTASAATGQVCGKVSVGGEHAPIVGRVSMDLITVDVTDLKRIPKRGEMAVLVGDGLTLESIGQAAKTIGYEVLTRLGPRFERVYIDGGD